MNTKYIDVASDTKNGCDDIECAFGWEIVGIALSADPQLSNFSGLWSNFTPGEVMALNTPEEIFDCLGADYYYRGANTTGIENLHDGSIDMHPNPTSDNITIMFSDSYLERNTQIALYDLTGREVCILYNATIDKTTRNFSLPAHITAGMYLLRINSEGHTTWTQKLTVSR